MAPEGQEGPCPASSPTDPGGAYKQLAYGDHSIVAEAVDRVQQDMSTFFLTNGWRSISRDGNSYTGETQTRIQLAFNGSMTVGCLRVNAEMGLLEVQPCSYQDAAQGFWIEQLLEVEGTSASMISSAVDPANMKLSSPGDDSAAIIQSSPGRICVYNADNDWAISAGNTYIPSHALTGLWEHEVPDSEIPTEPVSLPGCIKADGSTDFESMDCVIAISYNRAPAECATNPQATDCILNYLGAFCGDLVLGRNRSNNPIPDTEVENELDACARKISLGPCVANPTGAACMSGLFAGIAFPAEPTDEASGGGAVASTKKRQELAAKYALFPQERAKDHIFEEFVIGIVKQMANSVSDMVKTLFNPHAANSAIWCHGMAGALDSEALKAKCNRIWALNKSPAPQLEYDNRIQQAGAITSLVVSNLLAINEAITAAQAMTPAAWAALKNLFKAPEVAEATTAAGQVIKGFKLTAAGEVEGSGTVSMLKLGPEGDVLPFASEEESQVALEEALENGFGDCIEVDPPLRKRTRTRLHNRMHNRMRLGKRVLKRPMGLNLACPPLTSGDVAAAFRDAAQEAASSSDAAAAAAKMELAADAVTAKDVVAGTTAGDDLTTLHGSYLGFTRDGTETAPTWGPELEEWAVEKKGFVLSAEYQASIAKDFAAKYGVTAEETEALRLWSRDYAIQRTTLKSAVAKIPDYSGLVMRKTRMSQETIDMLVNNWGGRRGEPGVYDVSDLVVNTNSVNWENIDEKLRFIMASTPGITKYQGNKGVIAEAAHTFIIRSSKGKYITPMSQGQEEVVFIDGDQGRMKLLGWANGADGKPSVFYFDNIE